MNVGQMTALLLSTGLMKMVASSLESVRKVRCMVRPAPELQQSATMRSLSQPSYPASSSSSCRCVVVGKPRLADSRGSHPTHASSPKLAAIGGAAARAVAGISILRIP